ncbi:MAG: DUF2804 domain-containing protein [Solirubrobacteraceae bacterium]
MPPLWRGRPLKRWRWVGAFGSELMMCACIARVGPARQAFWAVLDRRTGRLHEGAAVGRVGASVRFAPGGLVSIRDGAVAVELELDEPDGAVETLLGDGGPGFVWTRKHAGIAARGQVAIDGHRRPVSLEAALDDTAGYHRRHTRWSWSAGIGRLAEGVSLAWNLVEGVNDPPSGSERTIWRAGIASEAPPARFASDLSTVSFDDGARLRFAPEAERVHEQNLLLLRSSYRAPFGTFSGELPGGLELTEGFGVMEHHDAHW